MKNKLIILILILTLISICTGCKKDDAHVVVDSTSNQVVEDIQDEIPINTDYTISESDALNKIDLFCDSNKCQNDNWFWGAMPIQGRDYEAGQIFKQNELSQLDYVKQDRISAQEMNDGYVNYMDEWIVHCFGDYDGQIAMIKYDLDGDGEAEIIGKCFTTAYGGTAGQSLFILKKSGDKYIDLSRYIIHPSKFQVLKRNPDKQYSCLRFQDIENLNEDAFFCYQEEHKSYDIYKREGNVLKEKIYEK